MIAYKSHQLSCLRLDIFDSDKPTAQCDHHGGGRLMTTVIMTRLQHLHQSLNRLRRIPFTPIVHRPSVELSSATAPENDRFVH